MPSNKVHLSIGILYYIIILTLVEITPFQAVTFAAIAVLYSLLPDIDAKQSKVRYGFQMVLVLLAITALLTYYFNRVPLSLAFIPLLVFIALQFVQHRKFIHTLRAAALFSLPLLLLGLPEALFGLLQYCSHLIIDRNMKL